MEVVLEKVGDRKQLEAILHASPFYPILGDDVELWLGSSLIGTDGRSRFWEKNGRLATDYHNNIMHLIGNQINGIGGFSSATYHSNDDRVEAEGLIRICIDRLTRYVEENYLMYKSGRINHDDKVLDIDNKSIFDDIYKLRTKLSELPPTNLSDSNFIKKAKELTDTYITIQRKYAKKSKLPKAGPMSTYRRLLGYIRDIKASARRFMRL